MDEYIESETQTRYSNWQQAMERVFMYKKPFFVNSNEVRNYPFDQIYVAPIFAKSGR